MLLLTAGRFPLLTSAQEVEHGQRVQSAIALTKTILSQSDRPHLVSEFAKAQGLGARRLMRIAMELATPEDRRILTLGDRGIEAFVNCNLRLVIAMAKKYVSRLDASACMDFGDMIQEGSLGLTRAAEKYDPTKGYRFSTYCYWWIQQAITRAIAQTNRLIRLPIHVTEKLSTLKKLERQAYAAGNYDQGAIAMALFNMSDRDGAIARLDDLRKSAQGITSLDKTISGTEEMTFLDVVSDESLTPEECAIQGDVIERVHAILSEVVQDDRQRAIVQSRLLGEATLRDVADDLGISHKTVGDLQKALRLRLRAHSELKELYQSA